MGHFLVARSLIGGADAIVITLVLRGRVRVLS